MLQHIKIHVTSYSFTYFINVLYIANSAPACGELIAFFMPHGLGLIFDVEFITEHAVLLNYI